MFSTWTSATAGCRRIAIALVLTAVVVLTSAGLAQAQAAAAPQAPAAPAQAAAPAPPRVFTGDIGFMYNVVKADKTADFEMAIAKLKEALAKSEKPDRKAQAAGWRVLKQTTPMPDGNILYVFLIDPVVKDADYTVGTILSEGFPPAEIQEIFKTYGPSLVSRPSLANYQLIASMK
jgi:hypothetical protein